MKESIQECYMLKQDISLQIFYRLYFTNFTSYILEYLCHILFEANADLESLQLFKVGSKGSKVNKVN